MDATAAAAPPPLTRWQSTWRYLFAALLGAGFWVSTLYDQYAWDVTAIVVVDLLLGVLSVVLMRWRRSHPLAVALVVNVLGTVSTAGSGAVIVTTVSLATRRRWREILPVVSVGFVASVVFFETRPSDEDSLLITLLFTVFFVSAVTATGMYVGARRDLVAKPAGAGRPRRTRAGHADRAGAGHGAGTDRP